MNSTRSNELPINDRLTISTAELISVLSCGRQTAVELGKEAGAEIRYGGRQLWNVEKLKKYLDSISN